MSIEELRSDLKANLAELGNLSALSTVGDVVAHLKNTMWPFIDAVTSELAEMDQGIAGLYNESEDILQFDTGKLFAGVIAGAKILVADLKIQAAGDPQKLKAIKEWEAKADEAIETIEEITLAEEESPDDYEEEGAEGDDDDDGDDDEGEDAKEKQ